MTITELSIIVPCYNSDKFLLNTISELDKFLVSQNSLIKNFEIILVVDGSPDDTLEVANKLKKRHKHVKVIELSKNYGQQSATIAGISKSKFEFIVTMDDDGQHRPDSIVRMCSVFNQETDLVYGTATNKEHGTLKKSSSKLTKFILSKLLDIDEIKNLSALRLFRKSLISGYDLSESRYNNLDVLLHWNTNRITGIEVEMNQRTQGTSNYSAAKILDFGISTIIAYSIRPLRLALKLGFTLMALNCLLVGIILAAHFTNYIKVPGYTSTILIIGLFGSVQLFIIGIVGEYVGKIYENISKKPNFKIRN